MSLWGKPNKHNNNNNLVSITHKVPYHHLHHECQLLAAFTATHIMNIQETPACGSTICWPGNRDTTWQISICFINSWLRFCKSSTMEAFASAICTVLSATRRAASLDLVRRSRALLSSCSFAICHDSNHQN